MLMTNHFNTNYSNNLSTPIKAPLQHSCWNKRPLETTTLMARSKRLTQIFRSLKTYHSSKTVIAKSTPVIKANSSSPKPWAVYLIISTNPPIKTYVGSTSDFSRRLKQHNGGLNGGAKATRAGKPWVCACLIRGFKDQSEACVFESKWKSFSKKLPRKRKNIEDTPLVDGSLALLQHRQAALNGVT